MQTDYTWTRPNNGISHLDYDHVRNRKPRNQYTLTQINDRFFECSVRAGFFIDENRYQCELIDDAVKWLVEKYQSIEG